MALKSFLLRFIPARLQRFIYRNEHNKIPYKDFINLSFSQEGEDLVLQRFFDKQSLGFYVDIGAHHPFHLSNTYKFYLAGWRGINIDPLPGSMEKFKQHRPGDINLELPVLNDTTQEVNYYMFDEPALNTFNKEHALQLDATTNYKIINTIKLKPSRLKEVLEAYLPANTQIDFMSVDAEGMDLQVLQSNDWTKYRPTYIVAESISTDLEADLISPLTSYLVSKQYRLIGKTVNSLFFLNAVHAG